MIPDTATIASHFSQPKGLRDNEANCVQKLMYKNYTTLSSLSLSLSLSVSAKTGTAQTWQSSVSWRSCWSWTSRSSRVSTKTCLSSARWSWETRITNFSFGTWTDTRPSICKQINSNTVILLYETHNTYTPWSRKRNQFCFVCVFLNTWQKLVNFFTYIKESRCYNSLYLILACVKNFAC